MRLLRFKKRNHQKLGRRKKATEEKLRKTLGDILSGRMRRPLQFTVPRMDLQLLESYAVGLVDVKIGIREGEGLYFVDEPLLLPEEEAAYASALDTIYFTFTVEETSPEETGDILREEVKKAAEAMGLKLPSSSVDKTTYYLSREIFGHSLIDVPMLDPNVEDIACNGPESPVTVMHRGYGSLGWLVTNIIFPGEDELADFIRREAHRGGKGISVARPYGDFILPDGSRMAGTLGTEVSRFGSSFSIRKFPSEPLTLPWLVSENMLSPLMAAYLWHVVEKKRIIFVAGPTASGKTTLSNALLSMLDPKLRFVTIEDTPEVRLPGWRWVSHVTRRSYSIAAEGDRYDIKLSDLIALSMRERPDYLIVGEVRNAEELIAFIETATTGHGGVTTLHANDPGTLLLRLRSMRMEREALDLLWGAVVTNYWEAGVRRVRRITSVVEVIPPLTPGSETMAMQVFEWDQDKDSFAPETVEELYDKSNRLQMLSRSLSRDPKRTTLDIQQKLKFIEDLVSKRVFGFQAVSQAVKDYYTTRIMPSAETRSHGSTTANSEKSREN